MNAKIIVAFILGAAAGVASSMFYFKTKYEQKADAEIQEIRDLYAKKTETEEKKEDTSVTSHQVTKADDLHATARHISEYTKYTPKDEPAEPQIEEPKDGIHVEKVDFAPMKNPNPPKPYLIDSSDYGQDDNFDPLCWEWYTDGILANENDARELLGLKKTEGGQRCGWVYDPNGPTHQISFGIDDYTANYGKNIMDDGIWIDFNVDGDIMNKVVW